MSKIGKLIHLYMNEIELGNETNFPEFIILSTGKFMNETGGRNQVLFIFKEVAEDKYQVIDYLIFTNIISI